MKRFEIITETDARVLPPGEPVMLARGGHITPLAQDTLRDRRVAVVHEGRTSDAEAALAPVADIRTVAVVCGTREFFSPTASHCALCRDAKFACTRSRCINGSCYQTLATVHPRRWH